VIFSATQFQGQIDQSGRSNQGGNSPSEISLRASRWKKDSPQQQKGLEKRERGLKKKKEGKLRIIAWCTTRPNERDQSVPEGV